VQGKQSCSEAYVISVVTMQLCWFVFKGCDSLNNVQRQKNVFPTPFDKDLSNYKQINYMLKFICLEQRVVSKFERHLNGGSSFIKIMCPHPPIT
jgi:hypothetical protein